jgi:Plavaka transposase
MLLTKIPSLKFVNTTFDSSGTKAEAQQMPGILKQQPFHKALRIVLAPLAIDNHMPCKTIGPDGYVCYMVPILMGWIVDLKEQLIIAGVTQYACLVSMATYEDLGRQTHMEPCTGSSTLKALALVHDKYPTASMWEFACEVKKLGTGLLGWVEHPFWEHLGVNPFGFICQYLLHGCHKFFWDHPAKWLAHTIGTCKLDN